MHISYFVTTLQFSFILSFTKKTKLKNIYLKEQKTKHLQNVHCGTFSVKSEYFGIFFFVSKCIIL